MRTGFNPLERTLAPSNVSQLRLKWQFTMNGSASSSVTINNGTAYIGSWNGYEYAVNLSSGQLDWKAFLGLSSTCSVGGIDSSATVWNGTLYVGGGNDHWYALNALNGSVEWSINVANFGQVNGFDWASPLIYRGFEYIGLASCFDSPLPAGALLQVNLTGNHTPLHTFHVVPATQSGGTLWLTPAVDPVANTVWLTTGNEGQSGQKYAVAIVGLNATDLSVRGSWKVPGVDGLDSDFGAGPTLFHDANGRPMIVATNKNGFAYALNRSNVTTNGTWKPVWQVNTGGAFSPGAFDGSRLYLGGGGVTINGTSYGGSVWAIKPSDGSTVWQAGLSQTVIGGLSCANGVVAVGAGTELTVLNSTNGHRLARFTIPNTTEMLEGPTSIAQGRIFFESGDQSSSGHAYELGIPLRANFTVLPENATAPGSLGFQGLPAGGSPPYNYSWTFGDSSSGWGVSPIHPYPIPGNYTVNVTIRDSAGATANFSAVATLTTSSRPITAGITASIVRGVVPFSVTFSGSEQNAAGATTYRWSFGDGSPNATGQYVSHLFSSPGAFSVGLSVRDHWGRSGNASVVITGVHWLTVVAGASPVNGTSPLNVTFSDVLSGGAAPFRYFWTFGDGTAGSNASTVIHEYVGVANYTVVNQVWDGAGATVTRTLHVSVAAPVARPQPLVAGATISPVRVYCSNNSTLFAAQGSGSGGTSPYTFSWTFGDGTPTVHGGAVTHAFLGAGAYSIVLNVTDAQGVSTTNMTTVSVLPTSCSPHGTGSTPAGGGGWLNLTSGTAIALVVLVAVVAAVVLARRRRR